MSRLDDMRVFAALAEAGSISAAARALGMPKQTVSRRLAALERNLGAELARRTTRTLSLTDVGRAYALRCAEITRLADEANHAVHNQHDEVSGTLRVTADHSFGEAFLPDMVSAFMSTFPDVNVQVMLTSRKVELLEEGFDLAFRIGPAPNVTYLAATRLGPARLLTVASPRYLEGRSPPKTPSDLTQHACLAAVPTLAHSAWPFIIESKLRLIDIHARLASTGVLMVRRAALAGAGVAHLPEFCVADDIQHGTLTQVLSAYAPEVGGIQLVYPHSQLLAPKVRAFVDTAKRHFTRHAPR